MKKIAWLILWLGMSTSYGLGAAEKIRITSGEWPPYLSQQLPYYGLASRIISAAFALEGIDVEYGFFPWIRAMHLAEVGAWQGTAVWRRTEQRERLFYLSDAVISSQYVFFYLRSQPFDWQTLSDLKPYRIGATREYFYGASFARLEKQGVLQVERMTSDEQNFQRLLHGRIDLFPNDLVVGYDQIGQLPPGDQRQITHHPRILESNALFLMLSRTDPANRALIDRFNRGLKTLRESGQIEAWQRALNRRVSTPLPPANLDGGSPRATPGSSD